MNQPPITIKLDDPSKPTTVEVANLIKKIIDAIKVWQNNLRDEVAQSSKTNSSEINSYKASIKSLLDASVSDLTKITQGLVQDSSDKWYKQLNGAVYNIEQQIKNIEKYDDSLLETKWATIVGDIHQKIENIKPFILQPTDIRDSLESLQGDERLDIDSVKGWEKVIADLKASGKSVRLVGGTNGIIVYNGSTKLGIVKYINFTGSGVSASLVNGLLTLTFSGSGGGGSGFQAPTSGVIDGVNKVFVWATAPNSITVDGGRSMQKVSSDSTTNWSGMTITTLAIAPNFDIFSLG